MDDTTMTCRLAMSLNAKTKNHIITLKPSLQIAEVSLKVDGGPNSRYVDKQLLWVWCLWLPCIMLVLGVLH